MLGKRREWLWEKIGFGIFWIALTFGGRVARVSNGGARSEQIGIVASFSKPLPVTKGTGAAVGGKAPTSKRRPFFFF